MENTISGDNQAVQVADNPALNVTEPAAGANGTAQTNGQAAGQPAPADENLGGFDPNRLPPELRKVHDAMLRDYRKKTGEVADKIKAEVAKATAASKDQAEFYQQFIKHPKLVDFYNSYVAEIQKQANVADQPQPDDAVRQKLEQIETKLATAETLEYVNAFADAKNDKGELLHPDFDRFSSFKIGTHEQLGDYDLLRACVELAPGNSPQEKMEAGYKAASDLFQSIFEEGRKAGLGRLQQKIRNSTTPPSSSAAANYAPHQAKNALEALEFARRGLQPQR